MIFFKLSPRHKKLYVINMLALIVALFIMLLISMKVNAISFPSNVERLKGSAGFIIAFGIFVLAIMNRLSLLFKVKSVGFLILFVFFLLLDHIIDPIKWTLGLMLIPLLIDDIILKPIWLNIWYNQYE